MRSISQILLWGGVCCCVALFFGELIFDNTESCWISLGWPVVMNNNRFPGRGQRCPKLFTLPSCSTVYISTAEGRVTSGAPNRHGPGTSLPLGIGSCWYLCLEAPTPLPSHFCLAYTRIFTISFFSHLWSPLLVRFLLQPTGLLLHEDATLIQPQGICTCCSLCLE